MNDIDHAIVGTTRTDTDDGRVVLHDECACGEVIDSAGDTYVAAMREAIRSWPAHAGR
jgi:hypothetical protein